MRHPGYGTYIVAMGTERLNQAVIGAVDAATASVRVLAEEAGLKANTVSRWVAGVRGASPAGASQLAKSLKVRALNLLELATELEALARAEGGDFHE